MWPRIMMLLLKKFFETRSKWPPFDAMNSLNNKYTYLLNIFIRTLLKCLHYYCILQSHCFFKITDSKLSDHHPRLKFFSLISNTQKGGLLTSSATYNSWVFTQLYNVNIAFLAFFNCFLIRIAFEMWIDDNYFI